jgi:hypothetical protein
VKVEEADENAQSVDSYVQGVRPEVGLAIENESPALAGA